ncbi:MAG: hypothetical protein MUF18_19120 [Fimbriiglobus sp.]|jgi:hypothetical protein|nr:hypothetical protein [Fimbriiglobus sp.]
MSILSYPIRCHTRGCPHQAAYKLGAVWADGTTRELKTYSLCCAACLPAEWASARERRERCRQAPGEELGPVGVFELRAGSRDRELPRREDLEL